MACTSQLPSLKDPNLKLVNGPPTTPAPASAASPASAPAASSLAASPGGGVSHPRTLLSPVALVPLPLVSQLQLKKMNTAWTRICFAGRATMVVWILVPLLVLPINLTHPFLFTRCPVTSPLCQWLPTFLLFPSLLPLLALSSRTDSNPSSFPWLLPPSLPIQPLMLPLLILARQTICFKGKSAFISYKRISNLQVRMGNNSFLPMLGWGTVIISLNGQRYLSGMPFMSPVWLCHCTAFGPILNSLAAVFWAPPSWVRWSTFHLLSYPLTLHPTAMSPMSPLALQLCWRVSITFNIDALLCFILWD